MSGNINFNSVNKQDFQFNTDAMQNENGIKFNDAAQRRFESIFKVLDKDNNGSLSNTEISTLSKAIENVETDSNGNFIEKSLKKALKKIGIKTDMTTLKLFLSNIKAVLPGSGSPDKGYTIAKTEDGEVWEFKDGTKNYYENNNSERRLAKVETPDFTTEYYANAQEIDDRQGVTSKTVHKKDGVVNGTHYDYANGEFEYVTTEGTSTKYTAPERKRTDTSQPQGSGWYRRDYADGRYEERYYLSSDNKQIHGAPQTGKCFIDYHRKGGSLIQQDWVTYQDGKITEGTEDGRHYTAEYSGESTTDPTKGYKYITKRFDNGEVIRFDTDTKQWTTLQTSN